MAGTTPFSPDDLDHFHAGQVWSHPDGRECTVLVVHDGSSISRGRGGLAVVQVGRGTKRVEGLDPVNGGKIEHDVPDDVRLFSGKTVAGFELSGCVAVKYVSLVVRGDRMTIPVPDRARRWVVRGGVGQFESAGG